MPRMLVIALLSCLLAAQAAPPAPAPAPAPAPPAAPEQAAPATPAPAAAPNAPASAESPAKSPAAERAAPRRVWVFIDRWKEFGGTVEAEDDLEITVASGSDRRTLRKTQVLDIIDLVDPREGGQLAMIELRDGSRRRVQVLSDTVAGVEFQVDGAKARLSRKQVYRVTLLPEFREQYEQIRAGIAKEDHQRRLALARWLVNEKQFELARTELQDLVRDSNLDAARQLLEAVEVALRDPAAAKAAGKRKDDQDADADPAEANPAAAPRNDELLPRNVVSSDDVNIIRVYELNFNDPPKVSVSNEGIRQLILRYGSSSLIPATTQERNQLYQRSGLELARLFFDLRARDLYRYIEVEGDPPSLAKFRTRVHNSWLIPNCGTSQCHGGISAGRFFLYTKHAKEDRLRYTNLLELLAFKVDGRPMVNFEDPESSLLVQYATARNQARFPHPDVKGYRPVFNQYTPQLHADTIEWIRSMYQPRPTYPVEWTPPKLDAPDKPVRTVDGPDR